MRVIIAGGRDFDDYKRLCDLMDMLFDGVESVEIISGGAKGADFLGERYAKQRGYELKVFPDDWNTHGKAAGPIRNGQMADYADALVVFWDGKSKGTKNMIEIASRKGLFHSIFKY